MQKENFILNRFPKSYHENKSKEPLEQIIKDLGSAYSEVEGGHAFYLTALDSEDETDINKIHFLWSK